MSNTDDELSGCELLKQAVNGNEQAFQEFCVRALPNLLKLQKARCQRFGIPPDLAEDFAQETLARAIKWVQGHRSSRINTNYISRISKNVVFDWLRQRRPLSNTNEQLALAVTEVRFDEEMLLVREAFEELPGADRSILELILIQGYTPGEVASKLGIKSWSAYKRFERSLKRLKVLMTDSE